MSVSTLSSAAMPAIFGSSSCSSAPDKRGNLSPFEVIHSCSGSTRNSLDKLAATLHLPHCLYAKSRCCQKFIVEDRPSRHISALGYPARSKYPRVNYTAIMTSLMTHEGSFYFNKKCASSKIKFEDLMGRS